MTDKYQIWHFKSYIRVAWECPRCGRMNAPFSHSCCCKKEVSSKYSESDIIPVIPKKCIICNEIHIDGTSCQYF